MKGILFILFSLGHSLLAQECGEVCYDGVECFTNCPPWDRFPLPKDPGYIGTEFRLYTSSSEDYTVITEDDLGDYSPGTTWFITHGFASRGDDPWVLNMKNALLQYDSSMSVVIIDWRAGALPDRDEPLVPYPSANAQVVARLTRNLIHSMQAKGLGLSDVSCGGHSVGSHLCGYIGKEFKVDQIGRVSGFDPAGAIFDSDAPQVRMDSTDAQYVDAIHTDVTGVAASGINRNVGQSDFWPHRGDTQPGCSGDVCDHMRAIYLFTESINSECEFNSRVCLSYEDMMNVGGCDIRSCYGDSCGRLGFHSRTRNFRGTFYLETAASEPYCLECCSP